MMRLNSFAINARLNIWTQQSNDDRFPDVSPFTESTKFGPNNNHVKKKIPMNITTSCQARQELKVPEFIVIDEDIYNKLYPKVPKAVPKQLIRAEYRDDTVEYDMDAEDQQWLEKCTKTRAADFEKVIEFLEKSSLHEIPSLYELQAHQLVDHIEAEKIFDYWLNKRLRTRQKMLFEIKRASDGQKKKKNFYRNPYVVFHQNIERMHTRKNRFKDNENYLEMLEHRKDLAQCRNFFKAIANQAKKKHEDMKTNLETFESIYQGQGLWNGFQGSDDSARREVEQPPPPGNPDPVIEVHYFTPRSGSKYFSPVINETGIGWASPKTEEHKTFCKLPGGLVRKRVGRGGRIVYDRQRHNTGTWNSEYKQVDINCYVKCKLIRGPFICSPSSTSNFVLTNSCIETEKCSPRERFQMK